MKNGELEPIDHWKEGYLDGLQATTHFVELAIKKGVPANRLVALLEKTKATIQAQWNTNPTFSNDLGKEILNEMAKGDK